jgi:hypothetical protein
MTIFQLDSGMTPLGHVSPEARVLIPLCGLGLCIWSLLKLRRRSLLVPTCSLFLTVGPVFIFFAAFPGFFDRLAYLIGITYPPVLYLIGCIIILMVMIIHLAFRLSLIDERCRRMAIELALLGSPPPDVSGVKAGLERFKTSPKTRRHLSTQTPSGPRDRRSS